MREAPTIDRAVSADAAIEIPAIRSAAARDGSGRAPPPSAAHFGLNMLALCGGLLALGAFYVGGRIDAGGVFAPLAASAAVAAIIVSGEMLWLGTGFAPSSGLARQSLRPARLGRVATRLLGLGLTLAAVAVLYWLFPEYHGDFYAPFCRFLGVSSAWPYLSLHGALWLLLAPLYFLWADRHLVDPADAYWELGALIRPGRWRQANWALLRAHAMGWGVKAFFLPLMVVYLDGNVRALGHALRLLSGDGMRIYQLFFELSYTIDVLFCVVGYALTLRLFDSHIRSTEPTAFGWMVALICYQPFYSVIGRNYLAYDDRIYWDNWLAPWPVLKFVWGAAIVALLLIYALSTVAFGLRFSNLTHRGIITGGPYRFSKHPAYLAKNLSWWLISVPFISGQGWAQGLRDCALLGLVNLVYYLRARTEERHLGRDPAYRAYALWIEEHGLLRGLARRLPFLRRRPPARGGLTGEGETA